MRHSFNVIKQGVGHPREKDIHPSNRIRGHKAIPRVIPGENVPDHIVIKPLFLREFKK